MKKVLLIAAVAGLGFVACKKDRTCTCTRTSDQPGYTSNTTTTVHKKVKKSGANCHDTETTYQGSTYKYTETCTLS